MAAAKASKPDVKKTSKTGAEALKRTHELEIGGRAPALALPGHKGAIRLADLKGQNIILYFYPKDDTSGCTRQACGFQDQAAGFKKSGAVVIGISKDDLASHEKFAKKYKLGFNLGADTDTHAAQAYGVWVEKSMYGRTYMGMDRATFLIDGKGIIRGIWRKVKVPGHVEEVLQAAQKLKLGKTG